MAAEKGEEAAPANEREEMEKRIQHRRERIKERLEINIFYYIYLLKIILNIFVCYQKFMSRKRLAKLRNMRLHQLKRKSWFRKLYKVKSKNFEFQFEIKLHPQMNKEFLFAPHEAYFDQNKAKPKNFKFQSGQVFRISPYIYMYCVSIGLIDVYQWNKSNYIILSEEEEEGLKENEQIGLSLDRLKLLRNAGTELVSNVDIAAQARFLIFP